MIRWRSARWIRPAAPSLLGLLALALVILPGRAAHAHKPSDSYLTLEPAAAGGGTGRWDIAVRDLDDALTLDVDGDGSVSWHEVRTREREIAAYATGHLALASAGGGCTTDVDQLGVVEHSDGAYLSLPLAFSCPRPPAADPAPTLRIDYRLFFELDPQHEGLVRIGPAAAARPLIFSTRARTRSVSLDRPRGVSLAAFVSEGVHHIWGGFDHVLFLLALLVPAVLRRSAVTSDPSRGADWLPIAAIRPALADVARIVTAFTAAHSLTLSLAALGLARMPARLTEAAIAASVVIAAVNNVRPIFGRDRWAVAFVLGLLHGFGFSSVLTDVGLASGSLLPALFGFNLGVELGQLAIVAAFVPVAFALRRTWFYRRVALSGGSLAIAAVALVWFVERAFAVPLFAGLGPFLLPLIARS